MNFLAMELAFAKHFTTNVYEVSCKNHIIVQQNVRGCDTPLSPKNLAFFFGVYSSSIFQERPIFSVRRHMQMLHSHFPALAILGMAISEGNTR